MCLLAELCGFGWRRGSFVKPAKVMRPGSHVIQLKTTDRGGAQTLMEKRALRLKELRTAGFYQDGSATNTAQQGAEMIMVLTVTMTESIFFISRKNK